MIEVNDYIEKSGLFFQKAKKNGSDIAVQPGSNCITTHLL